MTDQDKQSKSGTFQFVPYMNGLRLHFDNGFTASIIDPQMGNKYIELAVLDENDKLLPIMESDSVIRLTPDELTKALRAVAFAKDKDEILFFFDILSQAT